MSFFSFFFFYTEASEESLEQRGLVGLKSCTLPPIQIPKNAVSCFAILPVADPGFLERGFVLCMKVLGLL